MRLSRFASMAVPAAIALVGLGSAAFSVETSSGDAPAEEARKTLAEMRRELLEWRAIVDDPGRSFDERQEAAARIEAIDDSRMTPIIGQMWDREKELRTSVTRRHLVKALQTIAETGDHKAFLKVVEASIQDKHMDIRRDAAIWVGTQPNRDKAIPIFAKYLKTPKYGNVALTSLGYTQIPQNPSGPPDPDLVAAMIERLIDVRPLGRRVPVHFDTGRIPTAPYGDYPNAYIRDWGTRTVWVVDYLNEPNELAKELLSQYTAQYRNQDYGYDQQQWRKHMLQPLRTTISRPVSDPLASE
jgi:hypothetical protein